MFPKPPMTRSGRRLLPPQTTLGHYSIVKLIGQGGYGDIYEAVDTETNSPFAMKVERIAHKRQALHKEVTIMENLDSPYFPRFICYDQTSKYRYLVMELCGPSFSTVRKMSPERRLSLSTVLRSGIQMLRAIEAFHSHGFLHRDIKPSNFLIRASRRYPLALIDYGLSRPFVEHESGRPLPPRSNPGFVGTSKYASVNAHAGTELGRRDDLYSWFFSMIELWAGELPWSGLNERQLVYAEKCSTDITKAYPGMPGGMKSVYRLIRRTEREEEPNYKLLTAFMCQAMEQCGAHWGDPYEWENLELKGLECSAWLSLVPPEDDQVEIPTDLPEPVMPAKVFVAFSADAQLTYDARAQGRALALRRVV
jgi:serine/threonine protein kinase